MNEGGVMFGLGCEGGTGNDPSTPPSLSADLQVVTLGAGKDHLDLNDSTFGSRSGKRSFDAEGKVLTSEHEEIAVQMVQMDKFDIDAGTGNERNCQNILSLLINWETLYLENLSLADAVLRREILSDKPRIITFKKVRSFLEEAHNDILRIKAITQILWESLTALRLERGPIIQKIGNGFLAAVRDLRTLYPDYLGKLYAADQRLRDILGDEMTLRVLVVLLSRNSTLRRQELDSFLTQPLQHLGEYPTVLGAFLLETLDGSADANLLMHVIRELAEVYDATQLRIFHESMGYDLSSEWHWQHLVSSGASNLMTVEERTRQSILFELIHGEMTYVKQLQIIETRYIIPIRSANPPIIPHDRLPSFLHDAFHNLIELLAYHRLLLKRLLEVQRKQHPIIRSVSSPYLNAIAAWPDAYVEYIANLPIADYIIEKEMEENSDFHFFLTVVHKGPDLQSLLRQPANHLARYETHFLSISAVTPEGHEDKASVSRIQSALNNLRKEIDEKAELGKKKAETWSYSGKIKSDSDNEVTDLNLLEGERQLFDIARLFCQAPGTFRSIYDWEELSVFLFDDCLVLANIERGGYYDTVRRPIPLDLLFLVDFSGDPQEFDASDRSLFLGVYSSLAAPSRQQRDSAIPYNMAQLSWVYPCAILLEGDSNGQVTIFADSHDARRVWEKKLMEAIQKRKITADAQKCFETRALISELKLAGKASSTKTDPHNNGGVFKGIATCSVPFLVKGGRILVAMGCEDGIWVGLRHEAKPFRRVLNLKGVTQCAVLEDVGIFIVLANKSLFAYQIEALAHSFSSKAEVSFTRQKLSSDGSVQFFVVGFINEYKVIICKRKKRSDSAFRILTPVFWENGHDMNAPDRGGLFGFGGQRSEDWFRTLKDFTVSGDAYDLTFLESKLAILTKRGFQILSLDDFSVIVKVPDAAFEHEDPDTSRSPIAWQALAFLGSPLKRCQTSTPIGIYQPDSDNYMLCYDTFGVLVDKDGKRPINGFVDWYGTVERVALHPPYLLLFNPDFVEIRHMQTLRLQQIIRGRDIRCLWDNRDPALRPPTFLDSDGRVKVGSKEARIHFHMKDAPPQIPGSPSLNTTSQHIYELVPVIPQYARDDALLLSPSRTQLTVPPSPPLSSASTLRLSLASASEETLT